MKKVKVTFAALAPILALSACTNQKAKIVDAIRENQKKLANAEWIENEFDRSAPDYYKLDSAEKKRVLDETFSVRDERMEAQAAIDSLNLELKKY